MLIASLSDIHTDFEENRDVVVKLAAHIHREKADVIIVAGDVSHKNDRIDRALRALKEAAKIVAYIPGNHDLWYDVPYATDRRDLDTWRRYHVELRQVCETAGAHYLPASPLVLGELAIAGSCGWYDYSLAPDWVRASLTEETLQTKQYGGVMWSDARFIAFRDEAGELMRDPEVARRMERELRAQLAMLDANPAVKQVVAVTHHQPFYQVVERTGTLPWEFFNAFMGSSGIGEAIQSGEKVTTVIYGHTHVVREHQVGKLRVYGTPLGYPRERKGLSVEEIIKSRIGWIRT